MSQTKSILFERRGQLMLLVHGAISPRADEWQEYVDALIGASRDGASGLLVLTDGVGPDSTQRKMISEVKLRTAVVTLSRMARGIVTALGWLGADIRAFAPDQLKDALTSLGVAGPQQLAISHRLATMRMELAGKADDEGVTAPVPSGELDEVLRSSLATLAQR